MEKKIEKRIFGEDNKLVHRGRGARFYSLADARTKSAHIPVLLKEIIEILNPQSGEFFIDGTIGSGGHAMAILEKIGPKGKLLGIDWDREAIERLSPFGRCPAGAKIEKLKDYKNVILVNANYADLPEILSAYGRSPEGGKKHDLPKADGIILDLGFSSESLESGRGFSFLKNEPLDMRYNMKSQISNLKSQKSLTAAEVLNSFSEKDLAEIFWKYGEERYSRQIAKKIIQERKNKPIKTTFDLVEIIKKVVPFRHHQIHPATRVFQSLRIYVNDELGNLEKFLKNINKIIKGRKIKGPARNATHSVAGGRVAIISYHSLEDRLVKNYFREMAKTGEAEILTKKPIIPGIQEVQINPRSRSAKLRAIIKN